MIISIVTDVTTVIIMWELAYITAPTFGEICVGTCIESEPSCRGLYCSEFTEISMRKD